MSRLPNTPMPMSVVVAIVAALLLVFLGVGMVVKTWHEMTATMARYSHSELR